MGLQPTSRTNVACLSTGIFSLPSPVKGGGQGEDLPPLGGSTCWPLDEFGDLKMDEGPSRPAVRRSGAAAGTPLGIITSTVTAAIPAGPGEDV